MNAENWLGPGRRQTKWVGGCCKKCCEVLSKETWNVTRNVTRKGDQINMYYVLCIRPTKKIPDLYKWFVEGYLVFSRRVTSLNLMIMTKFSLWNSKLIDWFITYNFANLITELLTHSRWLQEQCNGTGRPENN